MKSQSTADLKRAILAVEAEQLKHPAPFRPDRAQRTTLNKSRRASDKMMSGFLKKAGMDVKAFEALQKERSAELDRMVAQHKKDSLRLASRRKGSLYSSAAAQMKSLRDLVAQKNAFVTASFTLDAPFLIWSVPLLDISDSAQVPFGSFAKFKFTSSGSGIQKVSFYFSWRNPFTDFAVINVATILSATGYLKAHAPWSYHWNVSFVQAAACLDLWSSSIGGVTPSAHDLEVVGIAKALGSPFYAGYTDGYSISRSVNLDANTFVVPPNALVAFEVSVGIDYESDGGNTEADFESGDFQISCPGIVLWLSNSPAGSQLEVGRSRTRTSLGRRIAPASHAP